MPGWAGGAQLCLSNAFAETKRLEAQAQEKVFQSGLFSLRSDSRLSQKARGKKKNDLKVSSC